VVIAGLALDALFSLKDEFIWTTTNQLSLLSTRTTKSYYSKNHPAFLPKNSSRSSNINSRTAVSRSANNSSGVNGSYYSSSLFPLQEHNMTTPLKTPTTMTMVPVVPPPPPDGIIGEHDATSNNRSNSSDAVNVMVQLSGGMGNNLCKLAHAIALQHYWIAHYECVSYVPPRGLVPQEGWTLIFEL
jgi:hypothetical protein